MRRIFLTPLVLAVAMCTAAASDTPGRQAGLEQLARLPSQHGGRIKPLATAAAEIASHEGHSFGRLFAQGRRSAAVAALLSLSTCDEAPRHRVFLRVRLFPTPGEWLSADDAATAHECCDDARAFAGLATRTLAAWNSSDAAAFNTAADELAIFLEKLHRLHDLSTARLSAELALDSYRPFLISGLIYILTWVPLVVLVTKGTRGSSTRIAGPVAGGAFGANLAALALYTWVAGRLPLNNTYEGMLTLAGFLGLFAVGAAFSRRFFAVTGMAGLLAGLVLLAAELTPVRSTITPPVPALQSLWLQVHVLTCFVAYAAFAITFAAALVVLGSGREGVRVRFDGISVRAALFGFIFLSIGILTGAAWARQAWGRYWAFDPKETWALVTWLVYAAYLHLALVKGRRRLLRAVAAIVGFLAVIFTFIGVNYLLPGLHSYA